MHLSAKSGTIVYIMVQYLPLELTARGLRSLSSWRDDSGSPLIASVFSSRSAARLLLVAPLLAAIGPAARVHVCLPGAAAEAH